MKVFVICIALLCSLSIWSQESDSTEGGVLQITGAIVESDSLKALPFVHISVKHSRSGTISDFYGFFSLVARQGDTVVFSSVGYQLNEFVIPDTLQGSSYSIIHVMTKDTILLETFRVFPWPTREQFKQAFMSLKLPDDNLERAKKNLRPEVLMAVAGNVPISGSTTYKYQLQNRYTQLYQAAGYPSIKLLDPIAWSKFIQSWQNGDFKEKGNINYLPK